MGMYLQNFVELLVLSSFTAIPSELLLLCDRLPKLYLCSNQESHTPTPTQKDTVLLMRWIVVQSGAFIFDPVKQEDAPLLRLIRDTAASGLAYYDRMYAHGLFLDRSCAMALYNDGNRFITGYCALAKACLGGPCLFGIKPKMHMWRHSLLDIHQSLSDGAQFVVSPLIYNCEQNEDAIGRLSTLSRRLDSRNISGRIQSPHVAQSAPENLPHFQTGSTLEVQTTHTIVAKKWLGCMSEGGIRCWNLIS